MRQAPCIRVLAGTAFACTWFAGLGAPLEQRGFWRWQNAHLAVSVDSVRGRIDVTGRRSGVTWRQPAVFGAGALKTETAEPAPVFRDVVPLSGDQGQGLRFATSPETPPGWDITVTLRTVPDRPELRLEVDVPDREVPQPREIRSLRGFVVEGDAPALAVADYCNGHLYPLDRPELPAAFFAGHRLDMPFLGMTDLVTGSGYALIIETSDDCGVQMERHGEGESARWVPRLHWWGSATCFRYPRRLRYCFFDTGGYVAAAKAYRRYAGECRLLRTLDEKAAANPNARRLFGAPDVWGNATLAFAREAHALGVEKMLIHGTFPPRDMPEIHALGYLTSTYDNYTDILQVDDPEAIDRNHGILPGHAVMKHDGSRMTAWLSYDKSKQYYKRCPALWLDAARRTIPRDLAERPYLGRFIDVTTAEGLYECQDPEHPLTRTAKRECGVALERYVWDLGLVGGGEHGLWWGVPWMCYIEGMMSANRTFSWPAGHLKHPKTKTDRMSNPWGRTLPEWETYATYGIGYRYRIPLWELVFHDCIVTTWYWGDATDWLLDAAPELTPRKDAFNILYGTVPLLWAGKQGSWQRDRKLFLRSYRNTCRLHEVIAGDEMLSHAFLSEDRALQKTVFSSGTEAVVNFGDEITQVSLAGRTWHLPRDGFVVEGPRISQSRALEDGQVVTRIRTRGYVAEETGDRLWEARRESDHCIKLSGIYAGLEMDPTNVCPAWDLSTTRCYHTDLQGSRRGQLLLEIDGGTVRFPDTGDVSEAAVLLCGPATARPDVTFAQPARLIGHRNPLEPGAGMAKLRFPDEGHRWDGCPAVTDGDNVTVVGEIANVGRADGAADIVLYADRCRPDRELRRETFTVAPGDTVPVKLRVPVGRLCGAYRLTLALECPSPELSRHNNRTSVCLAVMPDVLGRAGPERYRVPGPQGAGSFGDLRRSSARYDAQGIALTRETAESHPNQPGTGARDLSGQARAKGVDIPVRVDPGGLERDREAVSMKLNFAAHLPAGMPLAPGAISVWETDDRGRRLRMVRSQFEPGPAFDPVSRPTGTLWWVVRELGADEAGRYSVRVGGGPEEKLPPLAWRRLPEMGNNVQPEASGQHDGAPSTIVHTDGCRLVFADGRLRNVSGVFRGGSGPAFASFLFSSEKTGWADEMEGEVLDFEVVHEGPVRVVLRVRKRLRGGVVYEKLYTFHDWWFEERTTVNDNAGGLYSRAQYGQPATFVDSAGVRVAIDGDGTENKETYGKTRNPEWYLAIGDSWRHLCIPLSPHDHIAYWDSPQAMGQVGFHTNDIHDAVLAHVFMTGTADLSDWSPWSPTEELQRRAGILAARLRTPLRAMIASP